jgi:hypothetical protein
MSMLPSGSMKTERRALDALRRFIRGFLCHLGFSVVFNDFGAQRDALAADEAVRASHHALDIVLAFGAEAAVEGAFVAHAVRAAQDTG